MPATGDLCTVTPAAFSLYLFLGPPVVPITTFSWCSACFNSKRFFPSQEEGEGLPSGLETFSSP